MTDFEVRLRPPADTRSVHDTDARIRVGTDRDGDIVVLPLACGIPMRSFDDLGIEGDMIVEYTGGTCTCGCYQHCGVVPAEPVDRVLAEVDAVIEAGR